MNQKKSRVIRLNEKQMRLLIEVSKEKYPIEACGLLFGTINYEETVVSKVVFVRNTLKSSTNFQVDPEELIKDLFAAEKEKIELIGFFHSHPAAPYPSMTDIKYMKLWPKTIWLIISSVEYNMAAYQTIYNSLQRLSVEVNNKEKKDVKKDVSY